VTDALGFALGCCLEARPRRERPPSKAQLRVLEECECWDGTIYQEAGREHRNRGSYASQLAIDRTLDSCERRGWVQRGGEGYELTDAGRAVLQNERR